MNRHQVQKQFGANAARYVSSKVHAQGASLDAMVRLAAPQPHWLALDVAPGGGHSALAIAQHVRLVAAVDITFPMLQAARQFTRQQGQENIFWVQGDGGRLPFEDDRFDLVTCRVALHHFPDQSGAIADWARCLKPGGYLVLVDNVGPEDQAANDYINAFEKRRDPSHGRVHSPTLLIHFIEDAGLTLLSADALRKPMLFHPWMERMSVPRNDRAVLTQMLWESAGAARAFLNPKGKDDGTTFDLQEGLFLARKPER